MGRVSKYVTDGDRGCGAPGSREWHLCVLAQIKDEDVPEYMMRAFNITVEDKQAAKDYINEYSKASR